MKYTDVNWQYCQTKPKTILRSERMKKFNVIVHVTVYVIKEVEAEDIDDAQEKACDIDFSLTAFVGNGSTDRLCGVYEGSVNCESEPDYDEMEIIEK